jgi:hypothetical protein
VELDELELRQHLGRVRRAGELSDGGDDPDRLGEDPSDGCPGGDQRCWFVQSLLATYYRRRDQQGNRVTNIRLERCDDDLIIDAIAYFEAEESACTSFCNEQLLRQMERERRSDGT